MAELDVTLIGLGTMGSAMGHRLLTEGHRLTVHNRSQAKAEPLVAAGAKAAESAVAAVRGAAVIVLSLSDDDAVESVLFGPDGIADTIRSGQFIVDTSTVSPKYARHVTGRLAELGVQRVEACVIGNADLARNGELRVLAAGDVEPVRPVLSALGTVIPLGEPGRGAAMKLVFNAVLGGQLAALADAVEYGVAAGLDRNLLLAAVSASGFASKVMSFRCGLALRDELTPAAFRTTLMDKDLRMILADAGELNTPLPTIDAAQRRFGEAVTAGQGDLDAAVVLR